MPAHWRRLIAAALALIPLASATPVAAGEDAVERRRVSGAGGRLFLLPYRARW